MACLGKKGLLTMDGPARRRVGGGRALVHRRDVRFFSNAKGRGGATGGAGSGRGSLIPETLAGMDDEDDEVKEWRRRSKRDQAAMTREEVKERRRTLSKLGVPPFPKVAGVVKRTDTTVLQLNIGLYCNMACTHCHVESSPLRKEEVMEARVADRLVEVLDNSSTIQTVDITGGAPELCPEFRRMVMRARGRGLEVIDRCNLTVIMEAGQEDLADFLAENQVRIVASLPCYSEDNVNEQRGNGVFDRSIAALKELNARGYGVEDSGLILDLVYNPNGAFLPPPQAKLEEAYHHELRETYGIVFNSLFTFNNIPLKRFADYLLKRDQLADYMKLLTDNFNPDTVDKLMCRDTINVDWQGNLYDCDFNQQLKMGLRGMSNDGKPANVFNIDSFDVLKDRKIATSSHCFGCTAGAGSS